MAAKNISSLVVTALVTERYAKKGVALKFQRRTSRSEKGQSFVELGASLVLLLLILSGVVEFGMFMFQYVAMRDAANEGAIYISLYPTACNQTIERVKRDLYNTDPAAIQVEVTVDGVACHLASPDTNACENKEAAVTVRQANYPITMPLLGAVLGRQSYDITVHTTETILRPPCHP